MDTRPINDILNDIEAEVTVNETVDGSAITLMNKLADTIEENKNAPARLEAIVARMRASNGSLAAAVTANTPAAPETPEEEPEASAPASPAPPAEG